MAHDSVEYVMAMAFRYLVDVARHEGSARRGVKVYLEAEGALLRDAELAPLKLRPMQSNGQQQGSEPQP